MPKLRRDLSGKKLLSLFSKLGFGLVEQHGSHAKLKRIVDGNEQILTIPVHKEIDVGTARAVFNQASRFVPEKELRRYFYTE
ncbi:MAG TPA: type II toxin-antitoxin system HicA family toxin [Candidatus Paceibacterota bacterium]